MAKERNIQWIMVAVAAVALLSLAAFAYAREDGNSNNMGENDMMGMMGGKDMAKMHKMISENLDPEARAKMESMHDQCEELHKERK